MARGHGLRIALLWMIFLSMAVLLAFDASAAPGLSGVLLFLFIVSLFLAVLSLVTPVRGVRAAIQQEKRSELDWCNEQIRGARQALGNNRADADAERIHLAGVAAYRAVVQSAPEWPFDFSTFTRFALFVVIPVGSWFGGAMVERFVDWFLR